MRIYVEDFEDRWHEDETKEVTSVTAVTGSVISSYFIVEDDEGVSVESCIHPMQPSAKIHVLTARPGTKVLKVSVNADGSKSYQQNIIKGAEL